MILFEWTDETSYFDTNPRKFWGGDCWLVTHKCLIPEHLEDAHEDEIFEWIDANLESVEWL